MKVSSDPRHLKRIKLFRKLFTASFIGNETQPSSIKDIADNLKEIDGLITKLAPEWPVDKLNKGDLAILRLAIHELRFKKEIPEKVVIDEAVELSKRFGTEKTPKFVNGVLGSLVKK